MISTIRFRGPFRGLNLAIDSGFLGILEAEEAENIILDRGTLLKRQGFIEGLTFDGPEDGRITGIFDYLKNDGTIITLIASGETLYATTFDAGVWSPVPIAGSLNSGMLISFTTVNNRVYIANGTSFQVTDGATLFPASLPTPTVLPLQDTGVGTASLNGLYDYKFTWYSSTWGQESQAYLPSQFFTEVNSSRRLKFLENVPDDARITHQRIYRRKTSAGESDWGFVREIPVTPAAPTPQYIEETIDVNVDPIRTVPKGTSTLSDFQFTAFQRGVLYLAGSISFPNRLYYTRSNEPFVLQGFLEIGSGGDNDPITGLHAYQGVLVVFKSSSIWILSGDTKETFAFSKVFSGVGARGHFSIVNVDNLLFFLSDKGFFTFDGSEVREISEKIKPELFDRNQLLDSLCVGVHDYERGQILWAYCGAGSTTANKIAAYYYRNSRAIEDDSWTSWRFQNDTLSYLALVSDAGTRIKSLVFGFENGKIGVYGGDSDDGNPIPYLWRTGKQTGGLAELKKIWDEVTVQFRPQPVTTLLTLNYYLDDDLSAPAINFNHDMADEIFRRRVRRSSKEIRHEFQSNVSGGCEIVGWTQRAEVAKEA